jgi:hypothetical protein
MLLFMQGVKTENYGCVKIFNLTIAPFLFRTFYNKLYYPNSPNPKQKRYEFIPIVISWFTFNKHALLVAKDWLACGWIYH